MPNPGGGGQRKRNPIRQASAGHEHPSRRAQGHPLSSGSPRRPRSPESRQRVNSRSRHQDGRRCRHLRTRPASPDRHIGQPAKNGSHHNRSHPPETSSHHPKRTSSTARSASSGGRFRWHAIEGPAIVPSWTAGPARSTATRAGSADSVLDRPRRVARLHRRDSGPVLGAARRCERNRTPLRSVVVGGIVRVPRRRQLADLGRTPRRVRRGATVVAPYDENLLARARSYADVPLPAALWSLGRGRGDWQAAIAIVPNEKEIVIVHLQRGEMLLEDVARGIAHDAFHHAWDIRRSLEGTSSPSV